MPPSTLDLLAALVACNSINPAFGAGDTSEAEAADLVAGWLRGWGADVRCLEFAPGRRSVIGRLPGAGGGRSLMLYGHLDTVGIEGMTEPHRPRVEGDRLYGRGSYDMKGGLAACLAAARRIAAGPPLAGDLLVVAVADEETESRGMVQVLEQVHTDGAIVTEATELDVGVAHKGFCWLEVTTHGRAAHGSRPTEGVDANAMMGHVLVALGEAAERLASDDRHPLLGPGSMHVGTVHGGTGPSIYAASCRLEVERRLLPHQSGTGALADLQALLDSLSERVPGFAASCRLLLERPAFEQDPATELVRCVVDAATAARAAPPAIVGHSYWMDASLIRQAGIDTVVVGPAGAGAHAAVEYVELPSVERLAGILEVAARTFCGRQL